MNIAMKEEENQEVAAELIVSQAEKLLEVLEKQVKSIIARIRY